jgi:hypothetical protein
MTFLSRTNRGLRPVAALLPHADRAPAGSPVPRLAVPGRADPRRGRPAAVRDARDGRTPGTDKDPIPAMTRILGTRLPVLDSGNGRALAGRTPQAARTTVPAGASAAQSRASGGTVRARQDPASTVPMNTGLASGVARTATSGTGLTARGTGAALISTAQGSPDLTRTGLSGTGRPSTAVVTAAPSSTALSSAALASQAPGNTGPTSTDLRRTAPGSTALASMAQASAVLNNTGPTSTDLGSILPASTGPRRTALSSTGLSSAAPASEALNTTALASTSPMGLRRITPAGTDLTSMGLSRTAQSSTALNAAALGSTALTGTGLTSMVPNSTGPARTGPGSTGPGRRDRQARRRSGQGRSPRTRSRRGNQARARTGRGCAPAARPGSRIPAGTRTDPARANSDQGTRDRTGPATRAPATARPRPAGPGDAEDPGQWDRAALDSLAQVLGSMAPGIPVAVRTVRHSPDPAGTVQGSRTTGAERAGRAVSHPRTSPSQAPGRAVLATRRATGSIQALARPGRGSGQAAL